MDREVNYINSLGEDLINDNTLMTTFNSYMTNANSVMNNFLKSLNVGSNVTQLWKTFICGTGYNTGIWGYLITKAYMYETPVLLNMWSNAMTTMMMRVVLKIFPAFFKILNEMNILNSETFINLSKYGLLSVTNAQENVTEANATNDTSGTINFNDTTMTTSGILMPNNSTNLNPVKNLNIPLSEIDNIQNNILNMDYQGLQIFQVYDNLTERIQDIIKRGIDDVFKTYYIPFWTPLKAKKGVGW